MSPTPLNFLRSLNRTREIAGVLLQYGFGDVLDRMHAGRWFRWPRWTKRRRDEEPPQPASRAVRLRLAFEQLGPTFIKFGQTLSTRPDLVPRDLIAELSKLQEECPPFPSEEAARVVEEQLGSPVETVFAEFEPEPVAAGSLAQVHRARLHDGAVVAVKVRRPGVVREVERDLTLLHEFASLVEHNIPEAEVFDPVGLVTYFARTIRREMNFVREGRTLDEFARLFRHDASLFVPEVHWDHCTDAVLTMTFVDGIAPSDRDALLKAGIEPEGVATNGARLFMRQAFELGFFHGDPHPGNVRVLRDGSICLLDYGMIGLLDDELRENLIDLLVAVARKDVQTAVRMLREIGRAYRDVDSALLRADVREFLANYYGVELERVDVGRALSDFVTLVSNHGIRCPPDLVMLVRAIIELEGIGRTLDPHFNLADQLKPFLERIIRDRYSPGRVLDRLARESGRFLRIAHDFPIRAAETLEKLTRDDLSINFEHRGLEGLVRGVERASNRVAVGLVVGSLILASALVVRTGAYNPWITIPIFVLSGMLGLWLVYGIFRSGRL